MNRWHLSDPSLVTKTQTGSLYIVTYKSRKAVLKLLTATGKRDEKHSAIALNYFNGRGAVKLFQHDNQAVLTEFAEGITLSELVEKGHDEKATMIIANASKNLHNYRPNSLPKELPSLKSRFASLFNKADRDKKNKSTSLYRHAATVTKKLLSSQKEISVLHGDIHHDNILYSAERGWLAIDPKGLIGERTYDAANILLNPWNMPEIVENEDRIMDTVAILGDKLQLEQTRLLNFTFAHAALSAAWSLEDVNDPTHAINTAELIRPHLGPCIALEN